MASEMRESLKATGSILPWIHGATEDEDPQPFKLRTYTSLEQAVDEINRLCIAAWHAAKTEPGYADGRTPSDSYCAYQVRNAWEEALPALSSIEQIKIYIALIAWAKANINLQLAEAREHAYIAQVALSAWRLGK